MMSVYGRHDRMDNVSPAPICGLKVSTTNVWVDLGGQLHDDIDRGAEDDGVPGITATPLKCKQ